MSIKKKVKDYEKIYCMKHPKNYISTTNLARTLVSAYCEASISRKLAIRSKTLEFCLNTERFFEASIYH